MSFKVQVVTCLRNDEMKSMRNIVKSRRNSVYIYSFYPSLYGKGSSTFGLTPKIKAMKVLTEAQPYCSEISGHDSGVIQR